MNPVEGIDPCMAVSAEVKPDRVRFLFSPLEFKDVAELPGERAETGERAPSTSMAFGNCCQNSGIADREHYWLLCSTETTGLARRP